VSLRKDKNGGGGGVEKGGGTGGNSRGLMRFEGLTGVSPSAELQIVLTQKTTIKI